MQRRSIEVEGLSHGTQPIPTACRIGNIVVSGGISGTDPASHALPADFESQCAGMFSNVERVLLAAGAWVDDIAKMTIYVKDRSGRDIINQHWVNMFPDERSRPARHVLTYDLPGGMLVQCEILAVVG